MLGMENDKENRRYELGYLLLPTIAEQVIPETIEAIKSVITRAGGIVVLSNLPVSISLAYSIYRNDGGKNTEFTRAYFGFMHFSLKGEALFLVKKEVEQMPAVLRSLLLSDPHEIINAPSSVVEPFSPSPERPIVKSSKPLDDAALDRELADMLIS
jgi:ribosomal protein S6